MQSYIKNKRYYDKKAKASPLKEKDYHFKLQPKADHQVSKIPFRDFAWIGPHPIEKVLPNNNYIVRKLNTNKTQILHRIRLRKYNPEKPPESNCQEAQWQIDDNIFIPHDDLYTLAWETEFGRHLPDIPIIYTYPNAIDLDESFTQGPDTVSVPRSLFHYSSDGQNRETFLTSDPSVVNPSNLNSMVKTETLRPLQTYPAMIDPNKNPKRAWTLKLHMSLCHNQDRGRVITLQRLKSTILLPKFFRKMILVILQAANTTLNTQKNTHIDVCKILFQPFFVRHFYSLLLLFSIFCTRFIQIIFSFTLGASTNSTITSTQTNRIATIKIIYTIRINKRHR